MCVHRGKCVCFYCYAIKKTNPKSLFIHAVRSIETVAWHGANGQLSASLRPFGLLPCRSNVVRLDVVAPSTENRTNPIQMVSSERKDAKWLQLLLQS